MTANQFRLCLGLGMGLTLNAADSRDWNSLIQLAEKLQDELKLKEARSVLLAAQESASAPLNEHRLAYTLHNLGSVAQDEGRQLEAEKQYRRALTHWQAAGKGSYRGTARTLNNLASVLYIAGKWDECLELLERSEAIETQGANEGGPEAAVIFANRGTVYLRQRKHKQAETAYRQAAAILQRQGEPGEVALARVELELAHICRETGRKEEALLHLTGAVTILDRHVRTGPERVDILVNLAAAHWTLGRVSEAKPLTERALAAAEQHLGPNHPLVADILFFQAQLLRKSDQKDAARASERRSKAIREESHERFGSTISIAELAREVTKK